MTRFTLRQREVIELVRRGFTNEDIADALEISIQRVQQHICTIGAKIPGDLSPRRKIVRLVLISDPRESA